MKIPEIQPFQFIRGTAFSERVQLANKVNEIIDGINSIGDIPDIQAQVDALSSTVSTIQAGLASTDADLDALTEQVNSLISELNDTIKTQMTALRGDVSALDSRMDTAESDISGLDSEVQGLLAEVIDGVAMSSTAHGTVQVQINHEDGSNDISQPIDLGLVEQGGITLVSGTTDRSFKLHVELTDGTAWETNDMIIPPGGGTEVTVTGITLHAGTSDSYLQASIVLSDSTTIDSNDFAIVTTAQFTALDTRVTTAEGTIAQHTTQITGLDDRVEALEQAGGYVLVPATSVVLGGVKIGTGITVASDGTISIPNVSASQNGLMTSADKVHLDAAATAATFMFTADASKVTAHLDSVSGSEFTKDIPQASQGGAGTIDQASYAKIAANESAISELEADVAALAPSVSVNEAVSPPTITVGLNGKTATANLPTNGDDEYTFTSQPLSTFLSYNGTTITLNRDIMIRVGAYYLTSSSKYKLLGLSDTYVKKFSIDVGYDIATLDFFGMAIGVDLSNPKEGAKGLIGNILYIGKRSNYLNNQLFIGYINLNQAEGALTQDTSEDAPITSSHNYKIYIKI